MATTENYGVLYTPDTISPALPKSLDELLTPDIKFVRVQWIYLINTVRFRVLPSNHFRTLFANPASRAGVGLGKVALGLVGLLTAPGFGALGEHLYVPDLASWRVCTYAPGHASVMGWFQEKPLGPAGEVVPAPLCPRTLLQRLTRCVWVWARAPPPIPGCVSPR